MNNRIGNRSINVIGKYLLLLLVCVSHTATAEYSFEIEWDPYYSNIGYYQSLGEKHIQEVIEDDESSIYSRMLDRAFSTPEFMVVELGAYPIPYLGAYLNEHHNATYNNLRIKDFNFVQAFTAGYNEPYALSLFFGSVVRFVNPGEETRIHNRGYSGMLFSIGDQHIVKNNLVDDNWYELEWKIKGDQDFEAETLSWSLRAGAKFHDNPEIKDVFHFGLRRNHLDTKAADVSWSENIDVDFKLELNRNNFELSQVSFFVDKKWPAFFSKKSTFAFGVGFIYERERYSGSLASLADDLQLILRPSLTF